MKSMAISFLALLLLASEVSAKEVMTFTFRPPETEQDIRSGYSLALFRLALERTRQEYGDYRLELSPVMNTARAIYVAKADYYPNFFLKTSYQQALETEELDFVPFPVDLGIVGFRVCFASAMIRDKLSQITSVDQLRQLTYGQGTGWADVGILRSNGMQVLEIANYESLFNMVALNRFDLFCRGASEILGEFQAHSTLPNLILDTHLALVYPLPRFFYTHSRNSTALERINKGLAAAYQDGSLQALWRAYYQSSIDFVRLPQRKVFYLNNPYVEHLQLDYQRYFYDPLGKASKEVSPFKGKLPFEDKTPATEAIPTAE